MKGWGTASPLLFAFMNKEKIIKSRKIVSNVLSYSLIGFLFLIVTVSLIYKITDQPFYFFNTRFDVVLTDSMSSVNPEHKDFLKGHNDQIQAFDFVVSEKITDDTKLNVYDIVVFDNPRIGTDMHRIIDVENVGDTFELNNIEKDKINNHDVYRFNSPASSIFMTTVFTFSRIELVTYSLEPYDSNEYYININNNEVQVEVSSHIYAGYYVNYLTYDRNSLSPATFSITKKSYQFDSSFASIKLYGGKKECFITPELIKEEEKQELMLNTSQKYKIRGDKAKTDDGWYTRDKIQSKVVKVIPKFGYVARFLSSPYGTILILGIAMIPILYWIIFDTKGNKRPDEQQK